MAVPNSPLHDHRPHTLAISSGGFESYNSSLSSESKMLKSSLFNITPSVHERSVPDPSNFIPFGRHPLQTASQPNFTPLFTWLDQQHLGNDGRAFQDYNAGQNFTDTPIHNPCGSFENQNPTECEAWDYGTPRGSAHSTTSSMAWEDRSFQSPHDVTTPFQMDSNYIPWPFHPLPPGPGQEHLAGTSIVADTMNQTYKQRSSDAPAFDAADSSGPAMYTTTMNHHVASQPSVEPLYQDVEDRMTFDSYDTGSESAKNEPPYAKLIYKALMDAPEHKLILRDIYAWISNNTDKAKDPAFKGWQNSVRHNLSMNGVRQKAQTNFYRGC